MKKKILAAVLAVCTVISCLSVAVSAFGSTIHPLTLDVQITTKTDENRESWYSYTPTVSGTYSFLSYNLYATQCKLFVKETNPDTGEEEYVLLKHVKSDLEHWEENDHNKRQFCLTYELEKGVTYYYSAFWGYPNPDPPDYYNMIVKLRCDSYNEDIIDHIELSCAATLASCQNGWWNKDSSTGEWYFVYDPARIITNMNITVYFSDGEVKKVRGTAEEIDGYPIMFKYSQMETGKHWYPKSSSKYTANTLTVSILNASADFDVPIDLASYAVSGRIVDSSGSPIKNAQVSAVNQTAKTNADGEFVFAAPYGKCNVKIAADYSIGREIEIDVNKSFDANNFISTPVALVNCDYVNDGVVNTKDFAYAHQNLNGDALEKARAQISDHLNFDKDSYDKIVLK